MLARQQPTHRGRLRRCTLTLDLFTALGLSLDLLTLLTLYLTVSLSLLYTLLSHSPYFVPQCLNLYPSLCTIRCLTLHPPLAHSAVSDVAWRNSRVNCPGGSSERSSSPIPESTLAQLSRGLHNEMQLRLEESAFHQQDESHQPALIARGPDREPDRDSPRMQVVTAARARLVTPPLTLHEHRVIITCC